MGRILLPSSSYHAQLWNPTTSTFSDAPADIFENRHYTKSGDVFVDSVMYIKLDNLATDQVALIKITKSNQTGVLNAASAV